MAFLSYLQEARDRFFLERDPVKAETLLRPHLKTPQTIQEKRAVYELMGLILRAQGKFNDAISIYEQIQDDYQAGYCALMLADIPKVQLYWGRVLSQRQNHWCLSLYGLITRQVQSYPTMFQVRNHLESDIANLIAANRLDYLESILGYMDFLTQINLECPKFMGRSLLNAGWLNRAGQFLLTGQKTLPNDPEIYFHLGQYSFALKHKRETELMLKQCLMISPTYGPARELLNLSQETA